MSLLIILFLTLVATPIVALFAVAVDRLATAAFRNHALAAFADRVADFPNKLFRRKGAGTGFSGIGFAPMLTAIRTDALPQTILIAKAIGRGAHQVATTPSRWRIVGAIVAGIVVLFGIVFVVQPQLAREAIAAFLRLIR